MCRVVWQNFRPEQERSFPSSLQFLTRVLNRLKFPRLFLGGGGALCVKSPQALFTVEPNWARRFVPFPPPSRRRTHKSRHPSFVTPLSPQLVARARRVTTRSFLRHKRIHQPHRVAAEAASAIDGCDVPSLSACAQLSLCVGRGKRNLILAGFSLGPLLWFYPVLLAWRH